MKELVIISGKGGTGKTSIVASFAVLARNAVLADCDVDAADLHLVLGPKILSREEFRSGREARIRQQDCQLCGTCEAKCRFDAIVKNGHNGTQKSLQVDPIACEGCGVCVHFCPEQAIDFPERLCGELYVSETRCGPMVHAKLGIAAENSGKLVSWVRKKAAFIAAEQGRELLIVDGPPGIGCPVIASVTGAAMVLMVTEPTLSGDHDLTRVTALLQHFGIPGTVCINKWDLNPSMAKQIAEKAESAGTPVAGLVRYDREVTGAQIRAQAVVEHGGEAAVDIRSLWARVQEIGEKHGIRF